jgi:hypothetical protein
MHGGRLKGGPKGNQHALKHGRYTAEAIMRRRLVSVLTADARKLLAEMAGAEE